MDHSSHLITLVNSSMLKCICEWIKDNVCDKFDREVRKNQVQPQLMLELQPNQAPLETSMQKKADVGVYYHFNDQVYYLLQIEVDSGGYSNTVIKLAQGIVDQLSRSETRMMI